MISEYGSYDWKKLWNNIVQFPNESFYYVSKDHIILKVIEVSTQFFVYKFIFLRIMANNVNYL